MGEVAADGDVLREPSRQSEAQLVVGDAEVRLAPPAPGALAAEVVALHRHAVSHREARPAGTEPFHRPAPLVAGDDRILHVGRRARPLQRLDVAHADAPGADPDDDLALAPPPIRLVSGIRLALLLYY